VTSRRRFLIGCAFLLTSGRTAAQPVRSARLALLGLQPLAAGTHVFFTRAISAGLRDYGYVEGHNVTLDFHTADGKPERMAEVAAQVARAGYDVIITSTNEVTLAAKQATNSIPIVMALGGNPVGAGLVASVARPGGNITGLTFDAAPEAYAKPLEFLREIQPAVRQIGALRSTASMWEPMWSATRQAGARLGIDVTPIDVRTRDDIAPAFEAMIRRGCGAFIFWPDPITFPVVGDVARQAISHRLLGASLVAQFADAGGLLSYGPSIADLFRRTSGYVARILKGAKPAELPIEQPTKYELVLNLKSARAIGVTVPRSLALRADRLID
jgi:putative ABC transport system substrate-binding protein